jgi:S-adenosylmethionine:tRNA ribosyltransferase-isomerase
MMAIDPQTLLIKDFSYDLPDGRIAKYPLEERDLSKLLIYENDQIATAVYRDIDAYLPANSLLVFNNTKVVEARLLFQKSTGGVIEIFCLEPADQYPDITTAMLQRGVVFWKCLVGGASKWKHGMKLEKTISDGEEIIHLQVEMTERLSDCFVIKMQWKPAHLTFAEVLHHAGLVPLPPYLHREVEERDKERYQTIYAEHDGSVAAPTAGLHFTEAVFEKLAAKGISREFVTLHVGAGTFKPVKSEMIAEHEMHAEFIDVTKEAIQNITDHLEDTIVAVGTTSLRTIESLYWLGLKMTIDPAIDLSGLMVKQWDPYELNADTSPTVALNNLLSWMSSRRLNRLITKTQVMILPGYQLKIAKGIITNFHQPQSTLLLLIAAIVGDKWKDIYQYAMEHEFRFLSYGDGCLLWKWDNV